MPRPHGIGTQVSSICEGTDAGGFCMRMADVVIVLHSYDYKHCVAAAVYVSV